MRHVLTPKQADTFKRYLDSGHCAHLFPRKRMIRLQGWKDFSIADACAEMERQMDKRETDARVRAGLAACRR